MAKSKFIQSVVRAAGGRPKSTQWYKDKIKEFGKPGAMDLIRDGKQSTKPHYGLLNMFFYDPKGRNTLPYYDTFPLVLPLEEYPDGFLGINFHYLPMNLRLKLLDRVVDFSNNTKFDKTTIIMAEYRKFKIFQNLNQQLKDIWQVELKRDIVELMQMSSLLQHFYQLQDGKKLVREKFIAIVGR